MATVRRDGKPSRGTNLSWIRSRAGHGLRLEILFAVPTVAAGGHRNLVGGRQSGMEERHFWYEEGPGTASDSDSESVSAPRLIGKDVYLRAVTPTDYPFIQQIEMSSSLATRWRFRGRTMSPA